MVRIVATSDLHFNVPSSRESTQRIAAEICAMDADVLAIVGDTCGHELAVMDDALSLFESFRGRRLLVAGNHCLWVRNGQSSLRRYEEEIGRVAERHGFHYLDAEPVILDNIGFVGNVGWYDYSFASTDLGIPRRFYEHKVAPGAAAMLPEHRDLLIGYGDLRAEHLEIRVRWMDGLHVKLPYSDEEFTRILAAKLARHLEAVRDHVDQIVVAMHHLPFAELVVRQGRPEWDFGNAFMGSPLFGDILLADPKVRYCVCGHTHALVRTQRGHIRCMSVGSTYHTKRYEIIDIGAGACQPGNIECQTVA